MIPRFSHQDLTVGFHAANNRIFDTSDPGTGKTRSCLDAFDEALSANPKARALVLAPKSTLESAWLNDGKTFTPHIEIVVAHAKNREKMFKQRAHMYVTNHDAVNWLLKNPWAYELCTHIYVDESTAFKHRTSARSKALGKIIKHFEHRCLMTGTPNPNTILDIWHQVLLLDDGLHLGGSFWQFRAAACTPRQVGPSIQHLKWDDKPGIVESVADIIKDIVIRHKKADCLSIPDNQIIEYDFTLPPKLRVAYDDMAKYALTFVGNTKIKSIQASALETKLLQIASGAVYDESGKAAIVGTDRYELVTELIKQRNQCLVAFNWKHQRDELVKLAEKEGFSFSVIDGGTPTSERTSIIADFQAHKTKVIYAQPASTSHGITLTAAETTIWASPTYNAEQFAQFNQRIHRAGQTKKTETILIAAKDTLDEKVYGVLTGKLEKMNSLLEMIA